MPTLAVDVQILMLDAMGCAQSLSSIADSYPSRQIRMQFALGPTVLLYRIAIARGFTAGPRLSPSTSRSTSRSGRPDAACRRDQPVMLSATGLRKLLLPATSVLMTASPIALPQRNRTYALVVLHDETMTGKLDTN